MLFRETSDAPEQISNGSKVVLSKASRLDFRAYPLYATFPVTHVLPRVFQSTLLPQTLISAPDPYPSRSLQILSLATTTLLFVSLAARHS